MREFSQDCLLDQPENPTFCLFPLVGWKDSTFAGTELYLCNHWRIIMKYNKVYFDAWEVKWLVFNTV